MKSASAKSATEAVSTPHKWTKAEEALLGTMSDKEVADKIGLSLEAVQRHRRMLGVGPFRKWKLHAWTPEEEALLGKFSDPEVGRRLGISRERVKFHREKLGIAAYEGVGAPVRNWTPETEKLLGTMTDGKLAKIVGLHRDRVAQRRRRLGIPAVKPPRKDPNLIPIDGDKIRRLREKTGLTRFALAGHNTTLAAQLGTMEQGIILSVRPHTMEKLCNLLQCKPEDIMSK